MGERREKTNLEINRIPRAQALLHQRDSLVRVPVEYVETGYLFAAEERAGHRPV
jgi:hypothetical protein